LFRTAVNYRTLASAITVFLGGYLLISSLSGQLSASLFGISRNPIEVAVFLVLQALFALLVVVVGLLLAAAPMATRLIAVTIVIAGALIVVVTQAVTLTGSFGGAAIPTRMSFGNAYFMGLVAIGAAWLIVRSARVGWLSLIAAFVLIPVPYLLMLASIPSIITQIVSLTLSAIIGAGIIVAGRPLRD
jgi:hypothetical protein